MLKTLKRLSIKYLRKIFRKTNIYNSLVRELEMLVFRKILRMSLMDEPKLQITNQLEYSNNLRIEP